MLCVKHQLTTSYINFFTYYITHYVILWFTFIHQKGTAAGLDGKVYSNNAGGVGLPTMSNILTSDDDDAGGDGRQSTEAAEAEVWLFAVSDQPNTDCGVSLSAYINLIHICLYMYKRNQYMYSVVIIKY